MVRVTKIESTADNTRKTRKRVAAYCRVSTDSAEQMESLDAQKDHYARVIEGNSEWENAGLFFDEGISGTGTVNRIGFLSLMAACREGKVDLILTKSISRLSRNTKDLLETVRELNRLNVAVFFERENINTLEMEGEFVLTMLAGMAQDESRSISENVRWSIRERYKNGTFVVPTPPYGYRNVNKVMTVDEKAAKVVRNIFSLVLDGMGSTRIADELNQRGICSPRGGKWCSGTILDILGNETYTGDLRLQKKYTDDQLKPHVNRGERPQYLVKDHHEAIISRECFDKVAEMISENRKIRNVTKGDGRYIRRYPLTGRLFCSVCGHSMTRKVIRRFGVERIAWACTQHLSDSKSCYSGYTEQASIENAVMTMHNKLVFAGNRVTGPLLSALRSQSRMESDPRAAGIMRNLEENLKDRQRLRELLGKGFIDAVSFAEENGTLLEKYKQLCNEKNGLKSENNQIKSHLDALTELHRYLKTSEMKTEFDTEFFSQHVNKIDVGNDGTVLIHLNCGLGLKEVI